MTFADYFFIIVMIICIIIAFSNDNYPPTGIP